MDKIVIAIDGVSSSGKSTMAKQLAKTLGFTYIDTGAMYRAVTYYFLKNYVSQNDDVEIANALDKIKLNFKQIKGQNTCFLNGVNVESDIRSMDVSTQVSQVSAITAVRRKMVALQREMSLEEDVVMDGRDIGTVVFPNAAVKLYIHSPAKLRAERRFLEMLEKDPKITREVIEKNLEMRDHIDSTREDSPLKKADDAILIDNTNLNVAQQYETALQIIKNKLGIS
ncbi:MAG: (d)CMP kinase [Saprospiraceae bacterium]